MQRRTFLEGSIALASAAIAFPVHAQQWPSKTVQIVVPFGAGGGTTDPLARILADELARQLGGTFIVENKPGANGSIGAAYVKNSPPDGHVLLFTGAGTMATNPALYKNLPYDPQKDFEPVVVVGHVANVLVINPSIPVNNVSEFVEYLRKSPGKVNFGSTGNGSSMHTAGELFRRPASDSGAGGASPSGASRSLRARKSTLQISEAISAQAFVTSGSTRGCAPS